MPVEPMPTNRELLVDRIPSPLGTLLCVVKGTALCALDFEDYEPRLLKHLHQHYETFDLKPCQNPLDLRSQLAAYFNGTLSSLDGISVSPRGTAFQQQVWCALRQIPAGTTWTYGTLAAHLGNSDAVRAVGAANGQNPIAIAIPCHRVIGAKGNLTGYAGGLERKRWLLHHEGVELPETMVQLGLVLS